MDKVQILFDLIKDKKFDEFTRYLKRNEEIDVNIRDNNGNYLINFAILFNNIDSVSLLINRGSKLDMTDSDGRSILYNVIKYNYTKLLILLLAFNKTNIGISLVDIQDKNGNIPLHYAMKYSNKTIIKDLIEAGSDINRKNKAGYNALHLSVYSKDLDVVKLVVEAGANLNTVTKIGESSLHLASNFQLAQIVEYLVNKGADVNLQDIENEFTPLMYAVRNNDHTIADILFESDILINLQDLYGNSALHYAIIEDNFELSIKILDRKDVNVNVYNSNGKIPLHNLLIKNIQGLDNLVKKIIVKSSLNIQDDKGNSPLHILCAKKLWKEFADTLVKKKLNILIKNQKDKRVIDYIDTNDKTKFLQLVTNAYLNRLQMKDRIWKKDWENVCKKDFKDMTNDDKKKLKKYATVNTSICYNIIEQHLQKILISEKRCGEESYPVKSGDRCIKLQKNSSVESCTFTGVILDNLIGLIYLLDKHKKACSFVSTDLQDVKNTTIYDQFNFEILWVDRRLFVVDNFISKIQTCTKKGKRFVIIPLGIEVKGQGGHANYLIYDTKTNEIERFEPYGSTSPRRFNYSPKLLDKSLERILKDINGVKYIKPSDYLPKIGFQIFDIMETKKKKIGDPSGFCAVWSIMYTDYRMIYYDIDRKTLVRKLIDSIKSENLSFKNTIRDYSLQITKLRDEIFSKAGITINHWNNDDYTEEQQDIIVKEINNRIKKIT